MAGAFKTTPIKALEVDMAIPPIEITLNMTLEGYAHRLHKLKRSNPVIERLPREWKQEEPSKNPPPLPSARTTRNGKKGKLTQIDRLAKETYSPMDGEDIDPFIAPPWRRTARLYGQRLTITGAPKEAKKAKEAEKHNERIQAMGEDETRIMVYSDGSQREDTRGEEGKVVGWGIVGYRRGEEIFTDRGGLGQKAEVYDAELVGIAQAAKNAIRYADRHRQVKHIHIFADNTSAVTSAYEPKPKPGQKQMCQITHLADGFLGGCAERTMSIEWCPGHEKVRGNKRADEEAKRGTELWTRDYTTLTNAKRNVKDKALKEWTNEWKRTPPMGGFAVANRMHPKWKPREHVIRTPREIFGRLTQCRTKHAFIGEYYAKFVPTETVGCPCGEQYQTREHIIRECTIYEEHRKILQEADENMELGILLGSKEGLEAMSKFLGRTGAFTKTGKMPAERKRPRLDDEENEEEERWWRRMEGDREADFGLVEGEEVEGE